MNSPERKVASPFKVILAFTTVYIVWGSTYFFIQKAITGFPPFLLGAARFLVAGILMLGCVLLKGERVFVLKDIKSSAVSGFLMLTVGIGAVIWVEQYLPSAMVAIMVSSGPIWFILLDKPMWATNFKSKATVVGLMLGFAGVILLFSEKIISAFSNGGNHHELEGMLILIIGSMAWAGGSLYSKYQSNRGPVLVNSGWQILAAGVAFIPGSLLRGEVRQFQWHTVSSSAWLSLLYLIFFGSIAAFSAYVWLLHVKSATQVSTHAYVNPVVAVLLGLIFAGEHISMLQILGLVTILGSVLIINLVKYRMGNVAPIKETRLKKTDSLIKPVIQYQQLTGKPVKNVEV